MRLRRLATCALLLLPLVVRADESPLPPAQPPALQLEAGGPTAQVTALAFSPDGKTLYVGGYDKVVRTWALDDKGRFTPKAAYRIPVGPGMEGVINAMALSPDGRLLAVAGSGVVREAAGFREPGMVVPRAGRFSEAMLRDRGMVYLFDTRSGAVRLLRGHRGPVLAMAFAPARADKPPLLVSVARESDGPRHLGVARLWDAARGEELARSGPLPDPQAGRPGVAAWHTGKAPRDLAVAVAVERQALRTWEPGRDRLATAGDAEFFNDTVAFIGDADAEKGTLLTGTARGPAAHLDARPAEGATLGKARSVALPERAVARALAVVRDGGKATHAAVVLRVLGRSEYRLLLVALGDDFGAARADVVLWQNGFFPALAASPDGRHLAVVGNLDHEVRVFAVADLLAGRAARPAQTIGSDGSTFARSSFVRKGDRGLKLVDRREDGKGAPLVFDLRRRKMVPADGWQPDSPRPGDWKVEPVKNKSGAVDAFAVTHPREKGGTVRLTHDQSATGAAFLPPCPPFDLPFLAIAYQEGGVTHLGLYDVRSGRQVRQYTGHVNPVRALEFDAAGRLLVSTAEDQTVCVWSLTDLGETLGRRGALQGLAVGAGDGGLAVVHLDDVDLSAGNRQALTAKGVREDDLIEGIVGDRGLRRIASPHDFYEALWEKGPGKKVTLQVRGRGQVALETDQGIDDRKPLFSLFVTLGDKVADHQWVGWSPEGPFDTGDVARCERCIGWHRNTGRPEAPVSFSLAKRYHDEYYREDLLRHLVHTGALPAALDRWKKVAPPPPQMSLWVDELGADPPRDGQGNPIARRLPLTLKATVYGTPLAKLQWVRWRMGGGDWRDFEQGGQQLSADLSEGKWGRGLHRVALAAETLEARPARHVKELAVRFVPPAPSVAPDPAWLRKHPALEKSRWVEVGESAFTVRATAAPGDAGPGGKAPAVRVSVRHGGKVHAVEGLTAETKLDLAPGANEVEVRAENEGADPELLAQESASYRFVVQYTPPKKVPPPEVTILSVAPAGDEADRAPPGGRAPLVVESEKVRVRGRVTAAEALTRAVRRHAVAGKDDRVSPLSGFDPDSGAREFVIDEVVTLAPGKQELVYEARTAKAEAAPARLVLEYRPPLPGLEPVGGAEQVVAAREPADFTVVFRLTGDESPVGFTAGASANGEEAKADVDREQRRLSVPLKMRPGKNRVRVVLANEFGGRREATTDVYRQRPPRDVRLDKPALGREPRADLVARCVTDADVPPLEATLTGDRIGERTLAKDDFVREAASGDVVTWKAVLKAVPLAEGANGFGLVVRNADGESAEPAALTLTWTKPTPPKAQVEFSGLKVGRTVDTRRFTFQFQARSESPLRRVEVWHDGARIEGLRREGQDGGEVVTAATELRPGPNVLKVVVSNDGGDVVESRTVSYVRRTAVVRLVKLERQDGGGGELPVGGVAPVGNLSLHGYVEWPGEGDEALRQRGLRVRVWVNDFEQFDALLREAVRAGDTWRRPFRAEVRLNRTRNRVQLDFPGVKLEADERLAFDVGCARPERDQRLHLLIVAPGRRDQKGLHERVRKALQAREVKGDRFETPAFREGRTYGPLPWYVSREEVYGMLLRVKQVIRSTAGPLNDVVVVYFQGEEVLKGGKHYLMTEEARRGARPEQAAVDCDLLREILSDLPGAKLLLVDARASAPAGGSPRDENPFPHTGFLRYVWLGERDPGEEERLVYALGVCLGRASLLGDVEGLLRRWAGGLGPAAGLNLLYPPGLREMAIGAPEK